MRYEIEVRFYRPTLQGLKFITEASTIPELRANIRKYIQKARPITSIIINAIAPREYTGYGDPHAFFYIKVHETRKEENVESP